MFSYQRQEDIESIPLSLEVHLAFSTKVLAAEVLLSPIRNAKLALLQQMVG